MALYRYPMIVEKGKRNLSACIIGLDGLATTGKTLDDIRKNMKEGLLLHLEGFLGDGDHIPQPLHIENLDEYQDEDIPDSYVKEYVEVDIEDIPYTEQPLSELRDSK